MGHLLMLSSTLLSRVQNSVFVLPGIKQKGPKHLPACLFFNLFSHTDMARPLLLR